MSTNHQKKRSNLILVQTELINILSINNKKMPKYLFYILNSIFLPINVKSYFLETGTGVQPSLGCPGQLLG